MADRDGGLVSPGNDISDDTHVGADVPTARPHAPRSEAEPESLAGGQRVARADDMEGSDIDDPLQDGVEGLPEGTRSEGPAPLP